MRDSKALFPLWYNTKMSPGSGSLRGTMSPLKKAPL